MTTPDHKIRENTPFTNPGRLKLADLASLDDNEHALVLGVIDAVTTKAKLRAITGAAN